ncbi:MAG: peptide-methionine (S)-S-oxide reductase MsrA [Crocinitomicaceae bacterium]|jgi:peptide-methionine (S)-S-oxide reductase|nr:peptide-methionine (S)-S-oxide reductase MsrA [Crocinitomicaceae bacterium]MBT6514940.1 peptide-methionine (S)-S-oxide reductase MsrA [Crocinitomicaceae bacterium]
MAKTEIITLGAGCFWCIEAVFNRLEGVHAVRSGFSGGHVINPSYREVCGKKTGHAEVVEIEFDPEIIKIAEVFEIFWSMHDPTTINRQGNDIGPHYRSVIFYHNENQRKIAEEYKVALNNSGVFNNPIVTEITKWINFFPAENYHQDYFELNGTEPYCQFVVRPKIEKFEKNFSNKLRD